MQTYWNIVSCSDRSAILVRGSQRKRIAKPESGIGFFLFSMLRPGGGVEDWVMEYLGA